MKFLQPNSITFAKSMARADWVKVADDTDFQGHQFAAGSEYKAFETRNAGWVCFREGVRTPSGAVALRRLFKV